jgi:hypothetical protein
MGIGPFKRFKPFNGSAVREASRLASLTAFSSEPSRNHHDRLDHPLVPSIELRTGSELVNGSAPRLAAVQAFKVQGQTRVGNFHVSRILETSKCKLAPAIGDDPT